jgi:hypothetical protein
MKNYLELTDLWADGRYNTVAKKIQDESWTKKDLAEFCSYFAKYYGLKELNILHKFL